MNENDVYKITRSPISVIALINLLSECEKLKDAEVMADSISLGNDRSQLPDFDAQKRADKIENQCKRNVVAAFVMLKKVII